MEWIPFLMVIAGVSLLVYAADRLAYEHRRYDNGYYSGLAFITRTRLSLKTIIKMHAGLIGKNAYDRGFLAAVNEYIKSNEANDDRKGL